MATINTYTTLHTVGSEPDNDVITMYLSGGYGLTLTGDITLMTKGHYDVNSYTTLAVSGMIEVTDDTTLYIDSVGLINKIGYLFIEGYVNAVNTYAPLYIFGGTDGTYGKWGSIPLYMPTPSYEQGMPLFIKNTQSNVPMSLGRFLFIEGRMWPTGDNMTLFLENDAIDGEMTLYIRTPWGKKNYIPYYRGITLFINRPDESWYIPLFMKALDDGINSYITLHTRSAVAENDNITLAMPNVASQPLNSYISLMTEGAVETTDSATMFTTAHGVLTGSATLMIKQETGVPNSYITLHTKSAYLDNESMTLVIPETLDENNDSIPLYVFGW